MSAPLGCIAAARKTLSAARGTRAPWKVCRYTPPRALARAPAHGRNMNRISLLIAAAVLSLTGVCVVAAAAADDAGAKKPAEAGAAVQIDVDTSDAPELEAYGKKVKAVSEEWYPKIAALLPSDGYTPPDHVTIVFRKDYKGVAAASGNRVVCAVKWFTDHPDDVGAVVHELVHVVQQYPRGHKPGWLVEGIADQIRFFHYEPAEQRPHPKP